MNSAHLFHVQMMTDYNLQIQRTVQKTRTYNELYQVNSDGKVNCYLEGNQVGYSTIGKITSNKNISS